MPEVIPPGACLIGVTGFGAVHLRDLREQAAAGLMRFTAATVVNPGECADTVAALRADGVAVYDDYRAMLDARRGRDALCFVPTGHAWHRAMAVDAVAAGMNVFVEKPAAATVQDVRAMRDAARAAGRWVAVGFQAAYPPEILQAKELLVSGRIGAVRAVKAYGLWPRDDGYYARNGWAGRLRDDAGRWVLDSPFNNALAHYLNLPLFLAGATVRGAAAPVRVDAELYRARPIESADTCALRVATREGPAVFAWFTHVPDTFENEGPVIEARADRGRLRWTPARIRLEADDGEVVEWPGDWAPDRRPVRRWIMDRLRARLADPDAYVYGPDAALSHTAAVNAAHDAAAPRDFPADLLTEGKAEHGGRLVGVRGLAALTRRAYAEEKLFAELDAPWAAGGSADAAGYMDGTKDFGEPPGPAPR